MPGQHKTKPKAVRMPDGLEAWYRQHAASTGQTLNGALVAALEDYRRRHEPATATVAGVRIGITADPRQPPGTVSVISPGEEVTRVHSFTLAPGEPATGPENCEHPKVRVKGICPDCFKEVGYKS